MQLQLNGEAFETSEQTLAQVLDAAGYAGKVVGTAVNGTFVPTAQRADYSLAEGDLIEVLAPMQGG